MKKNLIILSAILSAFSASASAVTLGVFTMNGNINGFSEYKDVTVDGSNGFRLGFDEFLSYARSKTDENKDTSWISIHPEVEYVTLKNPKFEPNYFGNGINTTDTSITRASLVPKPASMVTLGWVAEACTDAAMDGGFLCLLAKPGIAQQSGVEPLRRTYSSSMGAAGSIVQVVGPDGKLTDGYASASTFSFLQVGVSVTPWAKRGANSGKIMYLSGDLRYMITSEQRSAWMAGLSVSF